MHDAAWDAEDIRREETAVGGGGPRKSWKKIHVDSEDVGCAVRSSVLAHTAPGRLSSNPQKVAQASSNPSISEDAEEEAGGVEVVEARGGCCGGGKPKRAQQYVSGV